MKYNNENKQFSADDSREKNLMSIKQKRWMEGWILATFLPFFVVLFFSYYFSSSEGYQWYSYAKILILFIETGAISAYFIYHRIYKAVVSLWIAVSILFCLALVVPYLAGESHVVLDGQDVSGELSTPLYLFISCLMAAWLLPGKFRVVARLICVLFILFYAIIQFTYIGYFAVSKALISVNMLLAVAQTNLAEAISYVDVHLSPIYLIALMGGLILFGVLIFVLSHDSFKKISTESKAGWSFVALLFLLNCGFTAWSISETRIAHVSYESYETLKSFGTYQRILKERRNFKIEDPELIKELNSVPDGIYVLVIGESLTRDHMGVYGYTRNTTPFQSLFYKDPNFIFFNHAYSCYTQTVQVLTCALTEKNQYNGMNLAEAYSIVDLAREAGFETTWISNQSRFGIWDTPIGAIGSACDNQYWINQYVGTDVITKDYDSALVPYLRKLDPNNRRQLIIVHLMGSHISYWDRYPSEFYKWPLDHDKDRTTEEVMIDEYDNSVLFNDYVMASIMNEAVNYLHADGVMYFSDHGEEVTANPGHNADQFNFMMVRIPFWVYTSDIYNETHKTTRKLMEARRYVPFTNDMLYETLMGMMGITVAHYDATCDLFSPLFNKDIASLMTMYGTVMISNDSLELGSNKEAHDHFWNSEQMAGGAQLFDWNIYEPIKLTESPHKEVSNVGLHKAS